MSGITRKFLDQAAISGFGAMQRWARSTGNGPQDTRIISKAEIDAYDATPGAPNAYADFFRMVHSMTTASGGRLTRADLLLNPDTDTNIVLGRIRAIAAQWDDDKDAFVENAEITTQNMQALYDFARQFRRYGQAARSRAEFVKAAAAQ